MSIVGHEDIYSRTYTDKNNAWKLFKFQNLAAFNNNTFHTQSQVFEHFHKYMTSLVEGLGDFKLREVELPQQDAAWARMHINKEKLMSNQLPRAVAMYNAAVNPDVLPGIINSQNDFNINRMIGSNYAALTVRAKNIKSDSVSYDYMRDINFTIAGNIKHVSISVFYSILLNEEARALDLWKMLKFKFPKEKTFPLYKETRYDENGTPIFVDFEVESQIPSKLMDVVKIALGYPAVKEKILQDIEVKDILARYASNKIIYKIDGGTRTTQYYHTYPCPVLLTPLDVGLDENKDGNSSTWVIKCEFNLSYVEFPIYKLTASLIKLNPNCEALQWKPNIDPDKAVGAVPINIAEFTHELGDTTIWDTFELEYLSSDITHTREPDEYDIPRRVKFATINILEICDEYRIIEYIKARHELHKCTDDFQNYVNIEIKRTKRKYKEQPVVGTEADIIIDWDNLVYKDYRAVAGDKVFIALYINKADYNEWLEETGWREKGNLSEQ